MSIRRRAFTLVEILVVIAIVTVLIALVMPVFARVRRTAAALASPIAYATYTSGLMLVHPTGRAELQVAARLEVNDNPCAGPVWSPNGRWLGYAHTAPSGANQTVVADPASGRNLVHDGPPWATTWFVGWADDSHFIRTAWAGGRTRFFVHEAETARLVESFDQFDNAGFTMQYVTPAPPGAAGRYTAAYKAADGLRIVLLRKDFSPGKLIWHDPQAGRAWPFPAPRMDPTGEFVAWTAFSTLVKSSGHLVVAMKGVRDPADKPPALFGERFEVACFCDWDEEGNILAAVYNPRPNLVLLDKSGRVVREVPTPEPPTIIPAAASWRKYQRQ